ncbi:hypothetical protein [Nocardioides ferulae]|uniref:hypothetical protein n=1 Tax=Nocardioides ferulae TaxID=2340821 RepID=UPI0013DE1754|nr:hypothetical protein [Nocardioides ferulae]
MTTSPQDESARAGLAEGRFTALPTGPRVEQTVATVDPEDLPDPFAGRNVDQHAALNDE